MKLRKGLVSNSSSSCYILDLRDEGAQELVGKVISSYPDGLGRCSAKAVGKDAVDFANEWLEEWGTWNKDWGMGIGHWILDWAEKLGEENVVFLRESPVKPQGVPPYHYEPRSRCSFRLRCTASSFLSPLVSEGK